jgi:hypothetical protein
MLTDENEVNADSKRVQMKGVLARLVCCIMGLSCRFKIFCSALAAEVGLVQNIFFLITFYFNSFVPIAKQAGQSAMLGRLVSYYVSLGRQLIMK